MSENKLKSEGNTPLNKSKLYLFHPKFKDYFLHRFQDFVSASQLTIKNSGYFDSVFKFLNSDNLDEKSLEVFLDLTEDKQIFTSVMKKEIKEFYNKADYEQFDNKSIEKIINNLDTMLFDVFYSSYKNDPDKLLSFIEYFNSSRFSLSKIDSIIDTSLNFDDTDDVPSLEYAMESKYKSIMPSIHQAFSSDGYLPNSLIVVSAPTGKGKSLFMLQTAGSFVKQGAKILYISVGADLTKSHILTRLLIQFTKKTFYELKAYGLDNALNDFKNKDFPELFIHDNFGLMILPPDEITASSLISKLSRLGYDKKFDSFFVDYDGHFAKTNSLDMYNSGGNIYAQLTKLTAVNSNIVFVGCQVNKGNYDKEFLGLEALAESSKKQHIAACVIMISDNKLVKNDSIQLGSINIPKARHGRTCFFYYLRDQYLNFIEIDKKKYDSILGMSKELLEDMIKNNQNILEPYNGSIL